MKRILPIPTLDRSSPLMSLIIDQDQAVSDNFLGRGALYSLSKGEKSLGQFRRDSIGELKAALEILFDNPSLSLQDLGAGLDSGTFSLKRVLLKTSTTRTYLVDSRSALG